MISSAQPPRTYQATLRVVPSGYWFTAGGQKGSFGYFPHLRNRLGLPVYPDTQVIGDLKMAAGWLAILTSDASLLDRIFGRGGGDEQGLVSHGACLKTGDLSLDGQSRSIWRPDRFEVKSRIQINDANRTVTEHFLVDLELARLDGLVLEAPLFLTIPPEDLDRTVTFLRDTIRLLSGFGAFRSRGYGRGETTITDFIEVALADQADGQPAFPNDERYHFALTALTNVRSKPVDPGHAQVVPTCEALHPSQLKGWLSRTYHETFGHWPRPEQMARINLSNLYPAPVTGILAWPAPMTTLTDARGNTKDTWGKTLAEIEQQENFFSGKVRPLSGHTVTEDRRLWSYTVETRMRNAMNDSFITKENGLYAQELLPAGTVFTGFIEFDSAIDPDFAERIHSLLTSTTPRINGALFRPTLGGPCPRYGTADGLPELLADTRPFSQDLRQGDNRIAIATQRGYNTMCRHPRRGRIMVTPGSILQQGGSVGELAWPGFGAQELIHVKTEDSCPQKTDIVMDSTYLYTLDKEQTSISSAQAGQLRRLRHPALTGDAISRMIKHRIEKYKTRDKEKALCSLLEKLLAVLRQDGMAKFRQAVTDVTEQLALARWQKKQDAPCQKAPTREEV